MMVSLEDFIVGCQCGGFLDGDGYGYYANEDYISPFLAKPSNILKGFIDTTFDGVLWYGNP